MYRSRHSVLYDFLQAPVNFENLCSSRDVKDRSRKFMKAGEKLYFLQSKARQQAQDRTVAGIY